MVGFLDSTFARVIRLTAYFVYFAGGTLFFVALWFDVAFPVLRGVSVVSQPNLHLEWCLLSEIPLWGVLLTLSYDFILSVICLVAFFYPLRKLVQQTHRIEDYILLLLQRYTLLTFVALTSTIISLLLINRLHLSWFLLCDNLLNGLCVVMMSSFYNSWYQKLCFCKDWKCCMCGIRLTRTLTMGNLHLPKQKSSEEHTHTHTHTNTPNLSSVTHTGTGTGTGQTANSTSTQNTTSTGSAVPLTNTALRDGVTSMSSTGGGNLSDTEASGGINNGKTLEIRVGDASPSVEKDNNTEKNNQNNQNNENTQKSKKHNQVAHLVRYQRTIDMLEAPEHLGVKDKDDNGGHMHYSHQIPEQSPTVPSLDGRDTNQKVPQMEMIAIGSVSAVSDEDSTTNNNVNVNKDNGDNIDTNNNEKEYDMRRESQL